MRKLIKLLYYIWVLSLIVFSGFLLYGLFFRPQWNQVSSSIFLGNIISGTIAFSIFILTTFIALLSKKHRKFAFRKLIQSVLTIFVWAIPLVSLFFPKNQSLKSETQAKSVKYYMSVGNITVSNPSPSPSPTTIPTIIPKPIDPYANDPILKDAQWGESVMVQEHSYKMKIGEDPVMANPREIYDALNTYRSTKGVSKVEWNDKMAALAAERVLEVPSETTPHEGFNKRLDEEGFWREYNLLSAGENASYGYRMNGVHLIEWLYASDTGHDGNQLNPQWDSVGIAVSGESNVLIFGDHP